MFDGTLANSTTLAAGTATGTATSATTGSQDTYGTLTTGNSWTTDDLQTRFVVITGGTGVGQVKQIASNTSNVLTIANYWSPTPDGTSTYAIQDAATLINTCILLPPSASGIQNTTTAKTAIRIQGNAGPTTITLRGLRITAPCTFGISGGDESSVIVQWVQVNGPTVGPVAVGSILFTSSSSTLPSTSGTHITIAPALAAVNASPSPLEGQNPSGTGAATGSVQFSVFQNGGTAISVTKGSGGSFLTNKISNVSASGIRMNNSILTNLNSNLVTCNGGSTSVGLVVVSAAQVTGAASHDHFSNCGTGVSIDGPSQVLMSTLNLGPTLTTGILVNHGGIFTHFSADPTFTSVTNQISLDSGAILSTWAAMGGVGNCVSSLGYGSKVCRDL